MIDSFSFVKNIVLSTDGIIKWKSFIVQLVLVALPVGSGARFVFATNVLLAPVGSSSGNA